jgi:hypothetical protein
MATKETKQTEEQDRTVLADRWAQAVADLDDARETLAHAEKAEAEAWSKLQRSREASVPRSEP